MSPVDDKKPKRLVPQIQVKCLTQRFTISVTRVATRRPRGRQTTAITSHVHFSNPKAIGVGEELIPLVSICKKLLGVWSEASLDDKGYLQSDEMPVVPVS